MYFYNQPLQTTSTYSNCQHHNNNICTLTLHFKILERHRTFWLILDEGKNMLAVFQVRFYVCVFEVRYYSLICLLFASYALKKFASSSNIYSCQSNLSIFILSRTSFMRLISMYT